MKILPCTGAAYAGMVVRSLGREGKIVATMNLFGCYVGPCVPDARIPIGQVMNSILRTIADNFPPSSGWKTISCMASGVWQPGNRSME